MITPRAKATLTRYASIFGSNRAAWIVLVLGEIAYFGGLLTKWPPFEILEGPLLVLGLWLFAESAIRRNKRARQSQTARIQCVLQPVEVSLFGVGLVESIHRQDDTCTINLVSIPEFERRHKLNLELRDALLRGES